MKDYKHTDITHKVIGCAMQVHSFLGNGFQEVIYQRALAIEFEKAGLSFQRQLEMSIYYKDYPEPIGKRRVDFFSGGCGIGRIKSSNIFRRCASCSSIKLSASLQNRHWSVD